MSAAMETEELPNFPLQVDLALPKPPTNLEPLRDINTVPLHFISTEDELMRMAEDVSRYSELAVDLEESSQFSYVGFICLMQISTRQADYLIDTIALQPLLNKYLSPVFLNNKIMKIFFGCHQDIGWLQRDFNLFVANCFDLQLLAEAQEGRRPNLTDTLKVQLNVTMDGKYQRADWRERPFTLWAQGMQDYARMNTHYLLPLYDQQLHVLTELAATHIISEVHARSNALSLTLFKPITVKDRVSRAMKKALAEFKLPLAENEPSEMQQMVLRKLLECREMAAKNENVLPDQIVARSVLIDVLLRWDRITCREALRDVLSTAPTSKYLTSFYRSFLAAKHEYYLMRNMRNMYSPADELRVPVPTVERKSGGYESKASTIKAVVGEYCRDVSKTAAPVFMFRQQQDRSGRQMFLAQATLALSDGSSLSGTSELFQYTKKAAEKLAALDLCLTLIARQHMALTANIVAEVTAFVNEKMLLGAALTKSVEAVFALYNVPLAQALVPVEDNTVVKAATPTSAERPVPVPAMLPVVPMAMNIEPTTPTSGATATVSPSGTKRRVDGSPVAAPDLDNATVHCKACGATLCPAAHLSLIHPHISISEEHRESVIGADRPLYLKEVIDEKERAMKPFKLHCLQCHQPVGSMIIAEKDTAAIPLFKGALIALKRNDNEIPFGQWRAAVRNNLSNTNVDFKRKRQKTEHVSPTRPVPQLESAPPLDQAPTLCADGPVDDISGEYHVYKLQVEPAEIMSIFAEHDASTKPQAILLLSREELILSTFRMRGKVPSLSPTITQYDFKFEYLERITLSPEQLATVKQFHKQWVDYALEGLPKNASLVIQPNAMLFTPLFAQSSQLIDCDKLTALMASDNALVVLENYAKQFVLGSEHTPVTLQELAALESDSNMPDATREVLNEVRALLRRELSGRIIRANYSNTSYIVLDVNLKQTPLSSFKKSSTEYMEYLAYFQKKGLVINNLNQPLISVSLRALDRINRTAQDQSEKFIVSTEQDIHLVPELCSIFGLTAEIRALSKLLPALITHLNETHLAFKKISLLEEEIGYSIGNAKLKKQAFTSRAFSEQCEVVADNYQLLEHLGDAVLEFLVTASLLHKFPKLSEDQLVNKRAQIVSNKRLSEIGDQLKLASCAIVPKKVSPHAVDRSKVSADMLEALIGALYLDQGLEVCVSFCNQYVFNDLTKTSFEQITAPPLNDQFDALPLTPAQETNLSALVPQFTNRNLLVQCMTHPSMFIRPLASHPMAFEEAQHRLGRMDYLKLKVMGYSLLKFVLTAHLYHHSVHNFDLVATGRTRSIEEQHHLIRAAYLIPSVLGHLARTVLQFSPQTSSHDTLLYNFNMSLEDLAAFEEFQSFGEQFHPRARPNYLAWVRSQWHSTSEAPGQYTVPDHAQLWADLHSAYLGARYVDSGLKQRNDTCHSCWDIDGGLIHQQLLTLTPPLQEVDPKADLLHLMIHQTGNTLLKLQYRTLTAADVDQSFISTLPLNDALLYDVSAAKENNQVISGVYYEHLCLGLGVGPTVKHAEKAAALNCFKLFSNELNITCFMNRLRGEDIAKLNLQ